MQYYAVNNTVVHAYTHVHVVCEHYMILHNMHNNSHNCQCRPFTLNSSYYILTYCMIVLINIGLHIEYFMHYKALCFQSINIYN